MSRALTLKLPAGHVAVLPATVPSQVPPHPPSERYWKREVVDAIVAAGVTFDGRVLDVDAVLDLPLPVFHSLRCFAELHLLPDASEPSAYTCRNCDAAFELDPATLAREALLQERLGGAVVGKERTFDVSGTPLTVRTVTVREVLPLWRAIVRRKAWEVSPSIVEAMGIVALGDERDPATVARTLGQASDRVWNEVAAAFDEMAYPDALVVAYFCAACEARNDLSVPADRELQVDDTSTPEEEAGAFVDADAFAALVERIGADVYERKGVRNIVLVADAGTPPCDQGGEPLLGSYRVLAADDAELRPELTFEIALFYESFRRMWEEDGRYDLPAEIEETLSHEVEHHLGHLAGRDEQDEDEVEEIKRELVKTYGHKALAVGLLADLAGDAARFARVFWPLLLLAAVAIAVGVFVRR